MKKKLEIPDANKLYANHVIIVPFDINQKTIEPIVTQVLALHMSGSKETLSVLINSHGGYLNAGWQLIELLMGIKMPVVTYCLGEAMSMGAMIFLAGDVRIATPRSYFMFHQYSEITEGKYHEHIAGREYQDKAHKIMINYINERAGKEAAKLLESKSDVFLSARKAQKLGIVDRVVSRIRIPRNLSYVRKKEVDEE